MWGMNNTPVDSLSSEAYSYPIGIKQKLGAENFGRFFTLLSGRMKSYLYNKKALLVA
jgi:hypothetical protein